MHNVIHSRGGDNPPASVVTGNHDGIPIVALRHDRWECECVAAGLMSDIDRAASLQVTTKHIRNVQSGKAMPGQDFIARVLRAFPRSKFDDLFEVQTREAS